MTLPFSAEEWTDMVNAIRDLQSQNLTLQNNLAQAQAEAQSAQAAAAQAPARAQKPQPSPAPTPKVLEPKISLPEKFDGTRNKFRGWLNSIRLMFALQPGRYPTDIIKIQTIGTYLTGTAQAWMAPLVERQDHALLDFDAFINQMQAVFGDTDRTRSAESKLERLRQTRSATEYSADFRQLSCDVSWNDDALMARFRMGLKDDVKDLMLAMPPAITLNHMMEQAVQCDNRLYERRMEKSRSRQTFQGSPTTFTTTTIVDHSEPMQIDAARPRGPLTPQERQRRIDNNLCLYCGKAGHIAKTCPIKSRTTTRAANMDVKDALTEQGFPNVQSL